MYSFSKTIQKITTRLPMEEQESKGIKNLPSVASLLQRRARRPTHTVSLSGVSLAIFRNQISSTGAPSTAIMAARTPSEGEPGG